MATYKCQCGEWMGEECAWTGPVSGIVVVEWMPEHLRASHEAAGNHGECPVNGAVRVAVERSCAETMLAEDGPEWANVINAHPTDADLAALGVDDEEHRCDGCGEMIEAELLAAGWPVAMDDDTYLCPGCYGDEAYCPEGHVLRGDTDATVHALPDEAATCAPAITTGATVEGGEPGTDDYDTGRVLDVDGDRALVAWRGSAEKTWSPVGTLRVLS